MKITTEILVSLIKKYRVLILALLVILVVSRLSLNLMLLSLSLYLVYRLSLKLVSPKIADTHTFVAVISIFFYVLILQSVSLVTWLISHSFPLSLNILFSLILVAAVHVPLRMRHIPPKRLRIKASDFVSFIVMLSTLIVFVVVPFHNTKLNNASGLLVLANYNVDDGAHLGLINARLQYNVATTVDNKADISSQVSGGISYPTGWPAANAAIIQAFAPSIKVGSATLIGYVILKVFWLLFLVFIFTRSIFALFWLFSNKPPKLAATIWIAIGAFLFTGWFLVDPFYYGFFSFIPQLITVPIFILSIIQLTLVDKKSDKLLSYLMLPVILSIGAALSWFLLFPVFTIALLLCLLNRITRFKLKVVVTEVTHQLPRYLVFYIVVILSLLSQIYIVFKGSHTGVSSTFVQSLLTNGGISTYPTSLYAVILLGIILFIILANITKNLDKLSAVVNYVVAMLGFAGFVYALQLYKTQTNLYYYFKILDTVTIVGILFAVLGLAFLVNIIQIRTSRYVSIIVTILMGLVLLQFAYPGAPLFAYIKGARALSSATDQQIFSATNSSGSTSSYDNGVVTIFYPSKNPELNEIASTLVQAGKQYTKCYATIKSASFSVPIGQFEVSSILSGCTAQNHIVYYVEAQYVESFRQIIQTHGLSSRVTVLTLAN